MGDSKLWRHSPEVHPAIMREHARMFGCPCGGHPLCDGCLYNSLAESAVLDSSPWYDSWSKAIPRREVVMTWGFVESCLEIFGAVPRLPLYVKPEA